MKETKKVKETTWIDILPASLRSQELEQQLLGSSENVKRIPLQPELGILKCNSCKKQIIESAFKQHLDICGKPIVKPKSLIPLDPIKPIVIKEERSIPKDEKAYQPKKKKKKDQQATVNLDIHCGVQLDMEGVCTRSISCKVHSIPMKRKVEGRSASYDILHQEHLARFHLQKKGVLGKEKEVEITVNTLRHEDIGSMISLIQKHQPKCAAQAKRFSICDWSLQKNHGAILDLFKA